MAVAPSHVVAIHVFRVSTSIPIMPVMAGLLMLPKIYTLGRQCLSKALDNCAPRYTK